MFLPVAFAAHVVPIHAFVKAEIVRSCNCWCKPDRRTHHYFHCLDRKRNIFFAGMTTRGQNGAW